MAFDMKGDLGDMMKGDLGNIMKEAQKMQDKMKKAQEELGNTDVQGEAGAGMVKIIMSCRNVAKRVSINQGLMEEDVEMLEDLVVAAINDAREKVENVSKEKIAALTAGLKLPTDLQLPDEDDDK